MLPTSPRPPLQNLPLLPRAQRARHIPPPGWGVGTLGGVAVGVMGSVWWPGRCQRATLRHGLRVGLVVAVVLQVTPFAAGSLHPLKPADGVLPTASDGTGPAGLCV